MGYDTMTLDQLFAELRTAAISEYEADEGPAQEAAVETEGELVAEIEKREGRESLYRRNLEDEHPRVRFRAAIGLERTDATSSLRILRELSGNPRLLNGLSALAMMEVFKLERLGGT